MSTSGVWRFGAFELDPSARWLSRGGVEIPLQPKVVEVLLVLVSNAGELVPREQFFGTIWADVSVVDANLTNSIATLRKVLGDKAIKTSSKRGYVFTMPLDGKPGTSTFVLDMLREGQVLLERRTTENVIGARNLFWLAISDDPGCPAAWAWLARSCRFLEKTGVDRDYHLKAATAAFRRAFGLDPDLACAHQFFTAVQTDCGEARSAMTRLLRRVDKFPQDAHSFAGLVQACRFCGLLDASLAAHRVAVELSPGIGTSVSHTHFARCDYRTTVESYAVSGGGTRGFLDLAAWACLGWKGVEEEIQKRLDARLWAPYFEALFRSLLAALRGDAAEVRKICESQDLYQDPEGTLYYARHLAFCGLVKPALHLLRQVVDGGMAASTMLDNDPWFASLRKDREFASLLRKAVHQTKEAERCFRAENGQRLLLRRV